MIARAVRYHSIAEWDFSLWFALQEGLAGAAAVSLHLREFVRNSRIVAALHPAQIELHNFSSLVNRSFRTASTKPLLIADPAARPLNRMPNSVDTLEPNDRFVEAVNKLPITPGIPYHSIIGDRGRGDTPNSSDGVVPYWSLHLAGAQSELIVNSDHGAQYDPQAIREVEM